MRQYRYVSQDLIAERLFSRLQALEAEHLQLSGDLAAAVPLDGEDADSFLRRKKGLEDRIRSIEATIERLEQNTPQAILEKVETLASRERAIAAAFGAERGGANGPAG